MAGHVETVPASSACRFLPWVGSDYRKREKKLLIIGESHYWNPEDNWPEMTSFVIDSWRSGDKKQRNLTVAARLVTGLSAAELRRDCALEGLSFYNFVQSAMPSVSIRPTQEQLTGSKNALMSVLQKLAPDRVVVASKLVWKNMPPATSGETHGEFGGKILPVYKYSVPSGVAFATVFRHFSRGFRQEEWAPVFCDFMSANLRP